ncbi:MAG: hypothetical protein WD401_05585 [Thermomicrobiaceae bacterium]
MRKSLISVELFGMPRVVAGTRRIETTGSVLAEIFEQTITEAPSLRDHIVDAEGTWLNPGYTFVVDGKFTNDPTQSVTPDSDVLLVSRASGG